MVDVPTPKDPDFRAPRPHLPLGRAPFAEVSKVFEGRKVGDANFYNPRVRRKPILDSEHPMYHVQTTFTEAQTPYVATAFSYLNQLLMGKCYGNTPDPIPPLLSERIVKKISSNTAGDYEAAVKDSILDTLADFYQLYPNLGTALYFGLEGLGIQGIRSTIDYSARLFTANKEDGTLEIPDYLFADTHEPVEDDPPFEIQCTGKIIAKTILTQSVNATKQVLAREGKKLPSFPANRRKLDMEIFVYLDDLFLDAQSNLGSSDKD